MKRRLSLNAAVLRILTPEREPSGADRETMVAVEEWLSEAPSALERMAILAAWKRVWDSEHPERRRGGDRRSAAAKQEQNPETGFWSEPARLLRLARSVMFEDVKIANELGVEWIKRLFGSPVDNSREWLRSFAALDDALREKIDRIMRAHPDEGWDGWARRAGLAPEPKSAEAVFERVRNAWEKAPREVRRRFLRDVLMLPDSQAAAIVRRAKKGTRA